MTEALSPLQQARRQFAANQAAMAPPKFTRKDDTAFEARLKAAAIAAINERGHHDCDPDFRDQAKCAGMDTEIFFGGSGNWKATHRARKVCAGCPVRIDCLLMSLKQKDTIDNGMFGGLGVRARRDVKRACGVRSVRFDWWRDYWTGFSVVEEPADGDMTKYEGRMCRKGLHPMVPANIREEMHGGRVSRRCLACWEEKERARGYLKVDGDAA